MTDADFNKYIAEQLAGKPAKTTNPNKEKNDE
jgi:hypothetical protein